MPLAGRDAGGAPCPADGRRGSARRCVVFDLETAPDRHAVALSRRRAAAPRGSPLLEVVGASAITFVERADGSLSGFDLRSWHQDDYREDDVLANLEAVLEPVVEDGGAVVTFNGTGHDLPVLRGRQLRWWQAEAGSVERIRAGQADHVDVMLALSGSGDARWPTLADACASVGFSLHGPNAAGRTSRTPRETEKCELDCVGTAILYLYVLAGRRRSVEPLRRGLPALGDFVRRVAAGRPHLERFALSRLLAPDAVAWGCGQAGGRELSHTMGSTAG